MNPMFGDLDDESIELLLREEIVARIAYVDRRGAPSLVPVAYAYDGTSLFGYSPDGSKLEGMRESPRVCVEVDRIVNVADWWSVVAMGTFEQLDGEAAFDAVRRLSERHAIVAHAGSQPGAAAKTYVARLKAPGIAYRIRIDKKHGRFARSLAS